VNDGDSRDADAGAVLQPVGQRKENSGQDAHSVQRTTLRLTVAAAAAAWSRDKKDQLM